MKPILLFMLLGCSVSLVSCIEPAPVVIIEDHRKIVKPVKKITPKPKPKPPKDTAESFRAVTTRN